MNIKITVFKMALNKSTFYRQDGTGRDAYISVDNGGFSFPSKTISEFPVGSFIRRSSNKAVTPTTPTKFMRYVSNGTGRDSYIMSNSGGFEMLKQLPNRLRFEGSLRTYGPSSMKTLWLKQKDAVMNRDLRERQERLCGRLSQPKTFNK